MTFVLQNTTFNLLYPELLNVHRTTRVLQSCTFFMRAFTYIPPHSYGVVVVKRIALFTTPPVALYIRVKKAICTASECNMTRLPT